MTILELLERIDRGDTNFAVNGIPLTLKVHFFVSQGKFSFFFEDPQSGSQIIVDQWNYHNHSFEETRQAVD